MPLPRIEPHPNDTEAIQINGAPVDNEHALIFALQLIETVEHQVRRRKQLRNATQRANDLLTDFRPPVESAPVVEPDPDFKLDPKPARKTAKAKNKEESPVGSSPAK